MIHAKKMMLVPYVETIQNPEEQKINELDAEMTNILHNKNLKLDEKISLYNTVLAKFLTLYKHASSDPSIISHLKKKPERNTVKEEKVESPDEKKYNVKKEEEAEEMKEVEDYDTNNFSIKDTELESLKLPTRVSPFNFSLVEPKSVKVFKKRFRGPDPYPRYIREDPNETYNELQIQHKGPPKIPPHLLSKKDFNFENLKNKIKTKHKKTSLATAALRVKENIAFKEKYRPRINKRVAGFLWENLNSMYAREPKKF
jgi:hypothetical protein